MQRDNKREKMLQYCQCVLGMAAGSEAQRIAAIAHFFESPGSAATAA